MPAPITVASSMSRTVFMLTALAVSAASPAADGGQEPQQGLLVAATCLDRRVYWLSVPLADGQLRWKQTQVST